MDQNWQCLHPTFVEYIDGARLWLEMETEKDASAVKDIRSHFTGFITKLIKSFTCK